MKKFTADRIMSYLLQNTLHGTSHVNVNALDTLFDCSEQQQKDVYALLCFLESDGKIGFVIVSGCSKRHNIGALQLTNAGIGYFETRAQEKKIFRRNFRYNMATAVVSTCFGGLVGWALSLITLG